jgi:hypothetical protein
MTCGLIAVLIAVAQMRGDSLNAKALLPHFYIAATDSTAPAKEIEPLTVPGYSRRLLLPTHRLVRRAALREITKLSGLQFVFAHDLVEVEDSVQFSSRELSVVDALNDALRGGSIDVVIPAGGNAVLVRRLPKPTQRIDADTITGKVTGDSGRAIAGALVRATMAPNRELFEAHTNVAGEYQLVIANGTGDYLVHISLPAQPGWKAVRKRVTRVQASQRLFVVDAVLKAPPAQALEQVTVVAARPKPQRSEPAMGTPDVGGAQADVGGVFAALSPTLSGNITASALTLPGVTATSDGFSVLGVSGAQNRVTLNGMTFGGAGVPRDARTYTTVTTSTYDPARGWFGGAEARVTIQPGNFLHSWRSSLVADHPAVQSGGRTATQLGSKYQNVVAGVGGDGLLFNDRLSYSVGLQASQRTSDLATIVGDDADALQHAGVSLETASQFRQQLRQLAIPALPRAGETTPWQRSGSVIARLNTPPYNMKTRQPARTSFGVIVAAAVDGSGGPTDILATPASAGTHRAASGSMQLLYSKYLTPFVLQNITVAANQGVRRQSAGLLLPRASVLTSSHFEDGSSGQAILSFGGNGVDVRSQERTIEIASETRFYPSGRPRHQVKINGDVRVDAMTREAAANALGSFSYNSLADLAAGQPSRFTRTLSNSQASARALNAFISIGDAWRLSTAARVQYGLRIEGNRFLEAPTANSALRSALRVDNSYAPSRLHVSPRLGFSWYFADHPSYGGLMMNGYGIYPTPPVGVLRGGIGEFRSLIPASLLADASVNTGLAGGAQHVACVGDAVPTPDWAGWLSGETALPSNCVDATPVGLQDAGPAVSLVSRRYEAPRSWRGNLSWTSAVGQFTVFAEGVYSLNLNQTGVLDRNWAAASRFTLPDDGRAVFVPATAIAPTGALVTSAARVSPQFGAVRELVSDLRSTAAQATLSVVSHSLALFGSRQTASLAYTLRSVRSEERGFDGTTAGNPMMRMWGRSPLDIRHSFVLQFGYGATWGNLTLAGLFASGRPFTPRVGADINGDGLVNDRAFVPDPMRTVDTTLRSELTALLANAPSAVRRCLERQRSAIVARNGCDGPWTADLNARIGLNAWKLGERWRPWSVSIFITNPLGGLDAALHGSKLRGWGSSAVPDPTLYRVVGFDASSRQFRYQVNPRFADTRPSVSTVRSPFRVTLDIQRSLGPSAPLQQLNRLLRPGRSQPGTKLSAEQLVARYRRSVLDPYARILEESDSLLLRPTQIAQLHVAQAAYTARVDSMWNELAGRLAALPDQFEGKAALVLQETTIDRIWDVGRVDTQATLPSILDAIQLKLLPYPASMYFGAKQPIKGIRYYSP